jgi:hypothetical protein
MQPKQILFLPYLLNREKKMVTNNSIKSFGVIKNKKDTDFQKEQASLSFKVFFFFFFFLIKKKN